MLPFVVLYITMSWDIGSHPFGFTCFADDTDHAEEQTLNAEPDADIVFTYIGDSYEAALDAYYSAELSE